MHLLFATIALRPYVFVFLAAFLGISTINFGLRTTLLFALLTYGVAWVCETSSVHNGFPFGLYHYLPTTRGREIWVGDVPFFDSLSFTFLGFASYTVALLLAAPVLGERGDLRLLETRAIRRSWRVTLLAALLMVMVDWVVDPLSVRGERWFLGKIFWYDPPGPHFGVPIANYLGWFFVALITIRIFQWLDFYLGRTTGKPSGIIPTLFWRALLGPFLYVGIVGFGITMLFRIGAAEIAWAAVFIYLPALVLAVHFLTRADLRASAAEVRRHFEDFPYDAPLDPLADGPSGRIGRPDV
ncbi:MAG TPA: carotenoid biosynthesis protein [Candidatus Binataceae bacterium]|jgi:putative membrane protein|nr:carotenoid biosynthesis protein [Candidatus Binataceae bacterium]